MGGADGENMCRIVAFVDSKWLNVMEFGGSLVAIWESTDLAVGREDEIFYGGGDGAGRGWRACGRWRFVRSRI